MIDLSDRAEANRRRAREHYWRNRDVQLVKMRCFRETHKEWRANYQREYQRNNRERLNQQANARARLKRMLNPKPRGRPRLSDEERQARVERRRKSQREYYASNREQINAARRESYQRNKDGESLRGKLYRERNREVLRARGRARYWRDPAKAREQSRLSNIKNSEKRRIYRRRYRAENRERYLERKRYYYERSPSVREKRHLRELRKLGKQKLKQRKSLFHYLSPWKRRERLRLRRLRKSRNWSRDRRSRLSDFYVRRVLAQGTSLKPEDFSPEIVRLQRMKIRLLRAKKQKTTPT